MELSAGSQGTLDGVGVWDKALSRGKEVRRGISDPLERGSGVGMVAIASLVCCRAVDEAGGFEFGGAEGEVKISS